MQLRRTGAAHLDTLREALAARHPDPLRPRAVHPRHGHAPDEPGVRRPRRGALLMASPTRPTPKRAASIEQLLAAKEIAVTCGSGGVGQDHRGGGARHDGRAASWAAGCSCSPSTRPAGSRPRSGLEAFGNVEKPVPPERVRRGRPRARGRAVGGDARHQAVVGRPRAPPRARRRRPATPSWPTRSTRTSRAGSSRATTTSRWSACTSSTPRGAYDLIVVDTPPTRNALDFLDAPQRMADFFSSRLLRWLTVPLPQPRS